MNEREFTSLINSPADVRYNYFIKRVADYEEVWVIVDENNNVMLTKDDEGRDLIPMWPFKAFADYCIEESMINCSSEAIDLSEFMDEFLPDIENYEILPSVFWNLEDSGVLTVKDLLRDLNNELLSYK